MHLSEEKKGSEHSNKIKLLPRKPAHRKRNVLIVEGREAAILILRAI